MAKFSALASVEGKNKGLKVTVPKKTVAAMSLPAPCWVRARVDGGEPFFVMARRPKSRNSVDVTLPWWCVPRKFLGHTVDVELVDAEPYRAREWTDGKGFDWLPFVATKHYFPTESVDGRLTLHARHEPPFVIRRLTALEETYRMLGLYQAEGSKSTAAPDFSLGNSNPKLLAHAVALLSTWGLGRDRLSLEVLRAPSEKPAAARAVYESLGVEIVAERVRTGSGGHAATLHVKKSQPLLRLVKGALTKVFSEEFPSAATAREYALGWLDGDGTITVLQPLPGRRGYCLELRLAGYEDEQDVVLRALHHGFAWKTKGGAFSSVRYHRSRSLDVREAGELALAGAFRCSMSRVRLLYEIERRCARGPSQHISLGELEEARQFLVQLRPEIETLRRVLPPERVPVGVKGLPYPM